MSVEVITFGCRLNSVESETMRRNALEAGHDNLIIINTCAVTAEAARQARQTIRRLGREQPDKRIIVTGCAAQTEPEAYASMAEVAQIIGNADKTSAQTWQNMARALSPFANDTAKNRVEPIDKARHMASHQAAALHGHTRGFIAVQNGCDHRCTFCIIPYGRGPSRSLAMGAVVEQIKALVALGQQDIVLTGVDLTSYGSDLPGSPRLGNLVQAILRHVPDLPRLRLSSIDSIEADAPLIDAMASEHRLMPHLHLSLQAGDDLILKRMKRRHSRADSVEFCTRIRKARPDIRFSADLIAGFPTETEAMFEHTLALIEDCGLSEAHIFPFSPRNGTPAAKMPQVAGREIKSRAARLRQAGVAAFQRHLQAQEGKILRVLSERGGIGRTQDFTPVFLGDVEPNLLLDVTISGHNGKALLTRATQDNSPRPAAQL
jgi:threonylcarbamoyladenosine tRNA methylthiotransferase MtaB